MKLLKLILITFFINCASTPSLKLPSEAKVVGQGGLFLREDCSQTFPKITLIPQFEKVTLIGEGPYDLISGISDRWYKARYKDKVGCLYGGYLNKNYQNVPTSAMLKLDQVIQSYKEKNHNKALTYANEALEIAPDYGEAYNWRGRIHYKLGKYEQCISDYSNALRSLTNSIMYNNRGICKSALNDYIGAKKDLDTALKLGGDSDATTLSNTCYVYGMLSDKKAIDFCNRAIETSPNNPYPYYERSNLRRKLGLIQAADEDLETYTKLKKTGEWDY
ncbi:hypothetical protein LPTSP4_00010 [Leptospira ryugenii]|uniref:Tetratricopeptide repeat protein n=1 Tax=Leptospira ryugenii TaxID=1917863 RepID=A0A2P2DV43_9LEPT|nr:tetratricopeptide repeat protein [Leptospira ryugenii]GBF48502.1 hypothetical protein LPTSP4_00010 [Leptospira ryugenii]